MIRYQGGNGEVLVINTGQSSVKVWTPYRIERKQGGDTLETNWTALELPNHDASVILRVPDTATADGPWRVWVKASDYRFCHWLQTWCWNAALLRRFDDISARHGSWLASVWISTVPERSPEPFLVTRYQAPTRQEWLALGAGIEPHVRAPTLAQWAALKGDHEPQFLGRTLSEWLLRAAPTPSASDTVQSIAALRADTAAALNEMGTNVIPWLLQWAQESSPQSHLLSRRGFGMLGEKRLMAVPALAELACTNVAGIRAQAYRSFSSIEPDWDTVWPALISALHQEDPVTRKQAAEFLTQTYPTQARSAGIHKFIDPWLRLRLYHEYNLIDYTNQATALDTQPK